MPLSKDNRRDAIVNVAIIGCGNMGTQIAQVYLEAGLRVLLMDVDEGRVRQTEETIRSRLLQKGLDPAAVMQGCSMVSSVEDLYDVQLVQEAVPEDLKLKQELFHELDSQLPETTILATNSSSFSISEVAAHCRRPERVLGVHWV